MVVDVVDEVGGRVAGLVGGGFERGVKGPGEVVAGDLEGVEHEAGAAGVEFGGGEAFEDVAEGGLDGGAVFGPGNGEAGGLGEDAGAAGGA